LDGLLQHVLKRREPVVQDDSRLLHKDDVSIRVAARDEDVDAVGMLVMRMYRSRGYLIPAPGGNTDEGPRRVTLEAASKGATVGTLSIGLDGPRGLQADALYRREIGAFRASGARVCEFTRLALDADDCGRDALAALFHIGFIFAYRIHRATDLFIEVNPRHALFYRRKLGFEIAGEQKLCPRVNAPAVLLHKRLRTFADELMRWGGLRVPANKTFYALCLTPWEENEVVDAIRAMAATDEARAA
jgi:hypothetical protein